MAKKTKAAVLPVSHKSGTKVRMVEAIDQQHYMVPLEGTSPLIMDRLPDYTKMTLRLGPLGLKSAIKIKAPTSPEVLFMQALYRMMPHGKKKAKKQKITVPFIIPGETKHRTFTLQEYLGIRSVALKKSLMEGVKDVEDVTTSSVSRCAFVQGSIIPIDFIEVQMEEFWTRNGFGVPIVKWLPHIYGWTASALYSIAHPALKLEGLLNLIKTAGTQGGIGVRRGGRGGIYGSYRIDPSKKIVKVDHNTAVEYNYLYDQLGDSFENVEYIEKKAAPKKAAPKKTAGKKKAVKKKAAKK